MSDQATALRQENEELRQRVHILEKALSATRVHFTVFDQAGRYLYVNPPGLEANNLRLEDVVGKTWRDLGFPEEVGIPFDAELAQVFGERATIRQERHFPTAAGLRFFETVIQPAVDESGTVAVAVAVHQDITEIKQAEAGLAAALDEAKHLREHAEDANRAKDTFLANMSHELRTPLNAILGYAQLLNRDARLNPDHADYLQTITRSGEHLLSLINDVLTMAKIDAQHLELQATTFDLHDHVQSLQTMFKMSADDKNLALGLEFAPDVPRHICTDEGKLRQIMMNLLSNAVKFTHEGGVTLRIKSQPHPPVEAEADPAVALVDLTLEVEDTGEGIGPDELDALFEPFVQTMSGQQSQQGTGLGLSISRQFAELMGGDIKVESTPGQGTRFSVQLPVTVVSAAEADVPGVCFPHRVTSIKPGQTAPDGQPYRLLVVEDNPTNRALLIELLAPYGFDLYHAENGADGVSMWEDVQPHLVWMDMRLPVMDGYAATRQIKARAAALGRPATVVALTATAFEENRQSILAAGCDEIVHKPFREQEILDVLQRQLDLKFTYETITPDLPVDDTQPDTLRLMVDTLPALWASDLHAAIVSLDIDRMHTLAEAARSQTSQLADILDRWIHDFRYEDILALVTPTPN